VCRGYDAEDSFLETRGTIENRGKMDTDFKRSNLGKSSTSGNKS